MLHCIYIRFTKFAIVNQISAFLDFFKILLVLEGSLFICIVADKVGYFFFKIVQ